MNLLTLRAMLPAEVLRGTRGAEALGLGLQNDSGQIPTSALGKGGRKRLVGTCQWVLVEQMGHLSLAQPWCISISERRARGLPLNAASSGGSQLVMGLQRWGPEEMAPCTP